MNFRSSFNPLRFLQPQAVISEQQLNAGLRWLTFEGMVSMGFSSITTSGFLAAFALALGANNFQIGLLAAIPYITQLLQIAATLLIEKLRWRKAITILTWIPAQLFWFLIAAIPFLVPIPGTSAVIFLLGVMIVRGLLAAITNCSWNTWISDLVPKNILGNFFARRSILSTLATVVFGLGGAFFVDYWGGRGSSGHAVQGYTYVIAFGALFMGLMSPLFMSLMPEPPMQPPSNRVPLGQMLISPLRDKNFKWLLGFLFFWSFASNLALPFFSVYMLKKIGIPISTVIALYVLSQFFSIIFLRVWGSLIDKSGNKVILSLSTSLYLLVILGWIFTLMPGRYFLTIPLLIALHIFAGIANAGVGLATSTIGLKLAPRSQATSYLSGVSLALNIGAGLGPVLGGFMADFFSQRHFNLTFTWTSPAHSMQIQALNITGFGFLFATAFFLGLVTLSVLANLREEGEVSRDVVLESLINPIRELYRPVSWGLPYPLSHSALYRYLKRIPLPGLDVALSVIAYQIADIVKITLETANWSLKTLKKGVHSAAIRLNLKLKRKPVE
jgi:MFS family permease